MYTQKLTVMPSDTACTGEIKLRSLCNYFQNVAGLAVADLEGTPAELMGRGYAWVLLQYELDIAKRLPGMDESFVVNTRHATADGFHTLRVFEVTDLAGTPLVRAKTSWILIDLAAGRPVRADRHLPEIFAEAVEIDPYFRKIPKPKTPFVCETSFPVRFHDLDANHHVNNAVYFEWMYEATPLDLMAARVLEAGAEFRVSAKYGDTVRVEVRQAPDFQTAPRLRAYSYTVRSGEEDGKAPKPLARIYALWETAENGGGA